MDVRPLLPELLSTEALPDVLPIRHVLERVDGVWYCDERKIEFYPNSMMGSHMEIAADLEGPWLPVEVKPTHAGTSGLAAIMWHGGLSWVHLIDAKRDLLRWPS